MQLIDDYAVNDQLNNQNNLPSLCRSKPLAEIARFFAVPSFNSRTELRRVNDEMLEL